jgi:hypothetical protein
MIAGSSPARQTSAELTPPLSWLGLLTPVRLAKEQRAQGFASVFAPGVDGRVFARP